MAELKESGEDKVTPYHDLFDGSDYWDAVVNGRISDSDMVLTMSFDGAQLYCNKASDTWIWIWILMDYDVTERYKKRSILVGGVIPGPNKPRFIESFLFKGLQHLAICQKKGLRIWNALDSTIFVSYPFLALILADSIAMAALSGSVGHFGRYGCRYFCPMPGRHQDGAMHYYPAHLCPDNFLVANSSHADIHITQILDNFTSKTSTERYHSGLQQLIRARTRREYESIRLETGIAKPSIISGLPQAHRFPVPTCFPGDIMHLPCLNITDLFLSLWRGTFKLSKNASDDPDLWLWAVLKGDVWKEHGAMLAECRPYLPGSFDRPPRNIAEKINSGYKAWEFLLYFYMLGAALLFDILPEPYYQDYCKLVRVYQILMQDEITPEELQYADNLYTDFSDEFEHIYIQRKADRLHMARQSIHSGSHNASETERIGPLMNTS
jgi:hypothetical protein